MAKRKFKTAAERDKDYGRREREARRIRHLIEQSERGDMINKREADRATIRDKWDNVEQSLRGL